jgi:serine/threonine protein kinase
MVDGRPYILMPYFGAGSLAERFATGLTASLHPGQLLNELSDALEHAHQHALIHGGLEPSHILLDSETGNVRLLGLGEAAVWADHRAGGHPSHSGYLSPEVRSGQPPTATSDQYSFGAIALELLTDVPADKALRALREAAAGNEVPMSLDLNERAALVLSKATDPDPASRFASVGEANRALQIALGYQVPVIESKPAPEPAAPPRKKRRRRLVLVPLLILLIGLIGVIPAFSAGLIELPEGGAIELLNSLVADPISEPEPEEEPDSLQAPMLNPEPTLEDSMVGDPLAEQPTDALPPVGGDEATPNPTTDSGKGSEAAASTPVPSTATPVATATPGASATPPPTDTPAATATLPPTATTQPLTAAPSATPKKCNSNPKSANYCTPTPGG